jgi:hypothetical protein
MLLLATAALHADTPRTSIHRSALQRGAERVSELSLPTYMIEFSDTLQIEPTSESREMKKRSLPAQFVPGIQSAAHSAARFLTEKVLRLR